MAAPSWYWYRLRAMTPKEFGLHAWKRVRGFLEGTPELKSVALNLEWTRTAPQLPRPGDAPTSLRDALRRDVNDILGGRWKGFGTLSLDVGDPPRWQCDYLSGKDLTTNQPSFRLDHRQLDNGADVKLIWELSRWHQLVRLAMASYVVGDGSARDKCIEWLENWVINNPPYTGWNWTSALEAGIRLIQFTWIDVLLTQPLAARRTQSDHSPVSFEGMERCLRMLREQILPAHVRFVWRHRSFGSSANNHLLGELAGCVLACVRWPALTALAAPVVEMQEQWEREVLAQFAEDGGNREQALNYHLFSFEFCWYTLKALEAAGRQTSPAVRQRLTRAALFFRDVQVRSEPWDYGDSDDAFVTPIFSSNAVKEWHCWIEDSSSSPSIRYWLGDPPTSGAVEEQPTMGKVGIGDWRVYPRTGMALSSNEFWCLRWDVSPLGYLATAAHGHLDALHLSLWVRGVALVIDPGTGAYYADAQLRDWLSSRAAHNGPCPQGEEQPRRVGPFLWESHHPTPKLQIAGTAAEAELDLGGTRITRQVNTEDEGRAWVVDDRCVGRNGRPAPFTVRWQFPPDSRVTELPGRRFVVKRNGAAASIQVDEHWAAAVIGEGPVSPAFRRVCSALFLQLTAKPVSQERVAFRTIFRATEAA